MMLKNKKGFTLIELIMVIVIIGILAGIAIPTFANLVRQAREGATRGALGAVRSTLAILYARSAASVTSGGVTSYPTAGLLPANFADGQLPLNAITGVRAIETLAALPASYVDNTKGFWYIPTGNDAGRAGAYVDNTDNLQDAPSSW